MIRGLVAGDGDDEEEDEEEDLTGRPDGVEYADEEGGSENKTVGGGLAAEAHEVEK